MASVTVFMGELGEKAIEFGPDAFAIDGKACFTVWVPHERIFLKRFCGKVVRISIEEVVPLRAGAPWRSPPHTRGGEPQEDVVTASQPY